MLPYITIVGNIWMFDKSAQSALMKCLMCILWFMIIIWGVTYVNESWVTQHRGSLFFTVTLSNWSPWIRNRFSTPSPCMWDLTYEGGLLLMVFLEWSCVWNMILFQICMLAEVWGSAHEWYSNLHLQHSEKLVNAAGVTMQVICPININVLLVRDLTLYMLHDALAFSCWYKFLVL